MLLMLNKDCFITQEEFCRSVARGCRALLGIHIPCVWNIIRLGLSARPLDPLVVWKGAYLILFEALGLRGVLIRWPGFPLFFLGFVRYVAVFGRISTHERFFSGVKNQGGFSCV